VEDEKDYPLTVPPFRFADATRRVGSSALRDLFGLLNRPDIIFLAGGFPAQSALDLDGLLDATRRALSHTAGAAFLYGECAGYAPLRELIAQREAERGLKLDPQRLMITTALSKPSISQHARSSIPATQCLSRLPPILAYSKRFNFTVQMLSLCQLTVMVSSLRRRLSSSPSSREALSAEIEEPFGTEPNDLLLDALSISIEAPLRETLGEVVEAAAIPGNGYIQT
jgi:hypothetical protein